MDILLISTEDACRTRIAQEILLSLGRGMKIFTAGVAEAGAVSDAVKQVMEEKGYEISRKRPTSAAVYAGQSWDYVITLSEEAEQERAGYGFQAKYTIHFSFDDALKSWNQAEQLENIARLFDEMNRTLYEFYRDELSEKLMPACTCGANTYCRCE